MALVDVVNKNVHPFRSKFRDLEIDIPAGGKIEMDHEDAILFLGEKQPMKFDGQDNQLPESYKMLFIEGLDRIDQLSRDKFICHMDGKVFHSKAELDDYVEDRFVDDLAEPDVAEKIKKKAGRPKRETEATA